MFVCVAMVLLIVNSECVKRLCVQKAHFNSGPGQLRGTDADTPAAAADDRGTGERVPPGEPALAAETSHRRRAGATARGEARGGAAAHRRGAASGARAATTTRGGGEAGHDVEGTGRTSPENGVHSGREVQPGGSGGAVRLEAGRRGRDASGPPPRRGSDGPADEHHPRLHTTGAGGAALGRGAHAGGEPSRTAAGVLGSGRTWLLAPVAPSTINLNRKLHSVSITRLLLVVVAPVTTRCVIITGTPNFLGQNSVNMRFICTEISGQGMR